MAAQTPAVKVRTAAAAMNDEQSEQKSEQPKQQSETMSLVQTFQSVLEDKKTRIQSLEQQLRAEREELAATAAMLSTTQELLGDSRAPLPYRERATSTHRTGTMVEAIHRILSEHGPLKVADIQKELARQKRKTTYGSVYATVTKDRRFHKVDAGLFGAVEFEQQEQPAA